MFKHTRKSGVIPTLMTSPATIKHKLLPSLALAGLLLSACSDQPSSQTEEPAHKPHSGGIQTDADANVLAPFDIVHTKITTNGKEALFHMSVSGIAGQLKPPTGQYASP